MAIITHNIDICNNYFSAENWTSIQIAGNLAIRTNGNRIGKKPVCRKVDKTHYVDVRDGEIRQYNAKIRESEDDILRTEQSIKATMRDLKLKVCSNFHGAGNELFITLTYAENMTDTARLAHDFDVFYKRLKYAYKSKYKFSYIAVCEPQGRGSWHIHMFLKCADITNVSHELPFIPNAEIERLWGQGFTKIERITMGGIVDYFNTSYFAPISSNDSDSSGEKQIEKYKRLRYFPKSFKWYRTSQDIKKPEKEYMDNAAADEYLHKLGFVLERENAFSVCNDNGEKIMDVVKREYARGSGKRSKKSVT